LSKRVNTINLQKECSTLDKWLSREGLFVKYEWSERKDDEHWGALSGYFVGQAKKYKIHI
jgi:hypothetical protein